MRTPNLHASPAFPASPAWPAWIARLARASLALLALAAVSCGGDSGVLLAMSWSADTVADAIVVETRVAGAPADSQSVTGPIKSPYRLLVHSPAEESLELHVQAMSQQRAFAAARLEVTPGKSEVLQISVELEPVSP
jgi:hypothetical protein